MKLNEQQQNKVMWAVGGVFGLVLVYYILNLVYIGPRETVVKDIGKQQAIKLENDKLKEKAAAANVKWKELNIPTDGNRMESDLRQTVNAAAGRSAGNFEVGRWNYTNDHPLTVPRTPERTDTHTDFDEMHFTLAATTTTSHIGRFLNYLESIKMPARIDKIKITSKKSGQDELGVDVYLSALVFVPHAGATPLPMPTPDDATGGMDDAGFTPGPGGIIKSLDPPLPPGDDIAEQMKKRRQMQLAAPEAPATTTSPK